MIGGAIAATLVMSSCSSHVMKSEESTDATVRLEQANYRVIATQVKGESVGYNFLSAFPTSIPTSLEGIGKIFKGSPDGGFTVKEHTKMKAIENLYKNCGDLRNRPTALINIREEEGGVNFLIFSRPKTTVTADVIEFVR